MGPTRGTNQDFSPSQKPAATARGHKVNEPSSVLQNKYSKGDKLMFVRRDITGDEKKAIFVRITNIAISCSGNNETVRVIKKQLSTPSSRASTPSMPGTPATPRRSKMFPKVKKETTRSYLGMLKRHRHSSFANMIDQYSQQDDSDIKNSEKRGVSLEDEVRQIDTFFNSLSNRRDSNLAKTKVHVQEDDFEIARLWKDLGYTVVKSKNRPSIFEIASPSFSPKQKKGLKDIRKSLIFLKHGTEDTSSATSNTESRGMSITSQPSTMSSVNLIPRKPDSSAQAIPVVIVVSPQLEAKSDDQANADAKSEAGQTSRIRRYYDKFKSLFSWSKEAQPPDKEQDPRGSYEVMYEPSRHVRWSDSKNSPARTAEAKNK